jgi:hypothetical protein
MEVRDLASLPRGSFYQVWVIPQGAKPIPDIRVPHGGTQVSVRLARAVSPGDTVAVTVERKPVSAPTTQPIISASLPA